MSHVICSISRIQRSQQQLIQVKNIEEFGIFGIIPGSLMLSKVRFRMNFSILEEASLKPKKEKIPQ